MIHSHLQSATPCLRHRLNELLCTSLQAGGSGKLSGGEEGQLDVYLSAITELVPFAYAYVLRTGVFQAVDCRTYCCSVDGASKVLSRVCFGADATDKH